MIGIFSIIRSLNEEGVAILLVERNAKPAMRHSTRLPAAPRRIPVSPYLLLVLTTLFWSGNFILARAVRADVPPVGLAFWRWGVALALLSPFALPHLRAQRALLLKSWKIVTTLGILAVSCFNTFVYIGVHTTSATNAVLLNSAAPVLIVLLSWALLGATVTRRQTAGIAVSLAGVLAIVSHGDPLTLSTLRHEAGELWVLLAVVSWALYTVLLKRRPAELHPFSFLGGIMIVGILGLAPLYAWEVSQGIRMKFDLLTASTVAYVAVFPSVLAYIFWNQAVSEVGANKAGLFLHLMPVFGVFLSFFLLGESPRLFQGVGICLIITGIRITSSERNGPGSRSTGLLIEAQQ